MFYNKASLGEGPCFLIHKDKIRTVISNLPYSIVMFLPYASFWQNEFDLVIKGEGGDVENMIFVF
jgi:hypothetical protein